MKGLILAAGQGERLKPLSKIFPKALIPIRNRPLIFYPLINLKKAGIKEIGIVIRPQDKKQFRSTLKIPGLKIKYFFQKRPQGTLKATQVAKDFIGKDTFLLCWCDFISPFDFKKLIQLHLKFRPLATILINKKKDPSTTAQVKFSGPYITKIVEKPKKRFSFWGLTGALVLEPEIFGVFSKIKPQAKGEYHIPSALDYLIRKKKPVRFLKINTWRINVNTLADLKEVASKLKKIKNF